MFFGSGTSCRNNSDRGPTTAVAMRHHEHSRAGTLSHHDEPFLVSGMVWIGNNQRISIIKNRFRLLECHAMLGRIAGSLLSIPFEEKFTHPEIAIHCIAHVARKISRRSAASFQFTQFSVAPARETDHGLPGLAVKKRNGRKLAWGSLLFDSHIRATNAPALHLVNPKNPAILSRKKIETGARRRGRPTKIRGDSRYSRGSCIYFGQTLISCFPGFSPVKGPTPGFAGSRGLPK